MFSLFPRSGNLLQNPSFESDLNFWHSENVTVADTSPTEGTQEASLGPGVASLYQDVLLRSCPNNPLFLSFVLYTPTTTTGDLVAEVLWLDTNGIVIGSGLRAFIPATTITSARTTFIELTDRPPAIAQWARLLFSTSTPEVPLLLDLVNLAPVKTPNLISNPSFELGLADWNASDFSSNFSVIFEGAASAAQTTVPGTLSQDLPLRSIIPGASYLLTFAASAPASSAVTAQLIWLNFLGIPIGAPGINAPVVATTLSTQGAYMNFMQASTPAPIGAVRARLIFTASGAAGSILYLDQINLFRLTSPNVLSNPGFIEGLDSWTTQGVTPLSTGGFVGENFALLSSTGAVISQTVPLPFGAAYDSFLFNFALRFSGASVSNGNVLAQVHWLNVLGQDIGLGLALVIAQTTQLRAQWQVFTGFTERAPIGAVAARIQFTKSSGGAGSDIGLDSVIFARVD